MGMSHFRDMPIGPDVWITFSDILSQGHHIFRRGMVQSMQLWPTDQNFQSTVWRSSSKIGGL